MKAFFELYLAWAGPSVISALVCGTIAWWLLSRKKPRVFQDLYKVTGPAIIAVLLVSIGAAILGFQPIESGGLLGVIAGIASAFIYRSKP